MTPGSSTGCAPNGWSTRCRSTPQSTCATPASSWRRSTPTCFPVGSIISNPAFLPLCVHAAMAGIYKICPDAPHLLVIPENHTRNHDYLQNVAGLKTILNAGLNVRIGTLLPEITRADDRSKCPRRIVTLSPCTPRRWRTAPRLEDFDPCAILVNNEFSAGVPPILDDLHEQCPAPPAHAGWATRRKSQHFNAYAGGGRGLCGLSGSTHGCINPDLWPCAAKMNFQEGAARSAWPRTSTTAGQIRESTRNTASTSPSHREGRCRHLWHGNHDRGTRRDVLSLNRRQRNKMSVGQGGPARSTR